MNNLAQNRTIRAYYCRAHEPSLAACPRAHLQIACPDILTNIDGTSPRHEDRESTGEIPGMLLVVREK